MVSEGSTPQERRYAVRSQIAPGLPIYESVPAPVEEEPDAPVLEIQAPAAEPVREGIREVNGDDLSDMFNVSPEDVLGDSEEGMDDLVDVSEEDVFGEGGEDMSDLFEVSFEDVTGYEYAPPAPKPRPQIAPRRPVSIRRPPPTSLGGLR